ncbi:serine/threonine protein kinase [Coleofasciculus sp. F4-SAH-05]|uniref:serine/threonine protein kinase n=1 Tax=Coleofasciculus sp. F4-SAH-05 TaxID=3069525 RepID=UPI0032F2AA34
MPQLYSRQNIMAQRYRILNVLGQGSIGTTYKAEDLQTGQLVAIKSLSLRQMRDWKTLDLFKREAGILAQLNHPAIPKYLAYFQVDFGAVSDTYHHTVTGGSTIVGTFGYMAPEQYRGQAVLSTDLYGLGATLLFLLTGKSPADFPQHQLKIQFRPHVQISPEFADWLERILEPAIAYRFANAKDALSVLQGEEKLRQNIGQLFYQSPQKRIALLKTQKQLILEIKPIGRQRDRTLLLSIP